MADYPDSVKTFPAINDGDVVTDELWEDTHAEVVAVENALLNGFEHDLKPSDSADERGLGDPSHYWGTAHLKGIKFDPTPGGAEGTFTPTLIGVGGSSGQVYTIQDGHYLKVGRLVYFSLRVALSTLGTITGQAAVLGLPFESAADGHSTAVVVGYWNGLGAPLASVTGTVFVGSSGVQLFGTDGTGTGTGALLQANLSDTFDIIISGTYRAEE